MHITAVQTVTLPDTRQGVSCSQSQQSCSIILAVRVPVYLVQQRQQADLKNIVRLNKCYDVSLNYSSSSAAAAKYLYSVTRTIEIMHVCTAAAAAVTRPKQRAQDNTAEPTQQRPTAKQGRGIGTLLFDVLLL